MPAGTPALPVGGAKTVRGVLESAPFDRQSHHVDLHPREFVAWEAGLAGIVVCRRAVAYLLMTRETARRHRDLPGVGLVAGEAIAVILVSVHRGRARRVAGSAGLVAHFGRPRLVTDGALELHTVRVEVLLVTLAAARVRARRAVVTSPARDLTVFLMLKRVERASVCRNLDQ